MKLLTFLGTSRYSTTTYTWENEEHECPYAPAATAHFLNPDETIVFLTEGAQKEVLSKFKKELPAGMAVREVSIPIGETEEELWQIFAKISDVVNVNDEVAFDITHGFRFFPLLGLLAAAFFRSGLSVKLQGVFYGVYSHERPERTPILDISPMLRLLDWAEAAARFNRTGDSGYLASLLNDEKSKLAKTFQGDQEKLSTLCGINNLGGALSNISQSLRLIRPVQTMEQVASLPTYINKAKAPLVESEGTKPFVMLLESIEKTYQSLGLEDPKNTENSPEILATERNMIAWYLEKKQWVQAVSLAREWLVSWVMYHLNVRHFNVLEERHRVSALINTEAASFLSAKKNQREFVPLSLRPVPQVETVLGLWKALTDDRNDIDHAGKREDPGKPKVLIKNIKTHVQTLQELSLENESWDGSKKQEN